MSSSFGLYACCNAILIIIIVRFSSSSNEGVDAFQCSTDYDRTSTMTTAYYNKREQPLTICRRRAGNETVEKHQLHIFEVGKTIFSPNDLTEAHGVGVLTALVRTSHLSSPTSIAFVVTSHAVNLDVFIEGDRYLSKIYLITPWKTKSSVSVTSVTRLPEIIQLDCRDNLTSSAHLPYPKTRSCEKEYVYHYFNTTLSAETTVIETEIADEWIIDIR